MSLSTISSSKNSALDSKRRRFQPPITTFFSATPQDKNARSLHLSHSHYAAATNSPTPLVSPQTQASLLSVGMRVRKSIAEGYKTKIEKTVEEVKPTLHATPSRTYTASVRAELTPFSGMGRPNHLATQAFAEPQMEDDMNNQLITDDGDAFSLPPSSQESVESLPPHANGQKRSFDYEDNDMDELDEISFPSTPSTWMDPLASNAHTGPVLGRTILAPRLSQQRRRFVAAQRQASMDVDDFEEPLFLRRREEVDVEYVFNPNGGREIQMGGI